MGLWLAFRSQGTEPTSTTLHLSKVNAGSREGCLWRPSPSGLSRPAPRPPHQDGAQRHLEIGHLVSPTGVTSPRGVFQGLEAPEVHAPVHGRHAGLEGHGAGQRRSVRLAEGAGVPARVRPAGLRSLVGARGWPRPRLRRLEEGTGAHAMAACAFIKSPVGQVQPAPRALSSPAGACSSRGPGAGLAGIGRRGPASHRPRPPPRCPTSSSSGPWAAGTVPSQPASQRLS